MERAYRRREQNRGGPGAPPARHPRDRYDRLRMTSRVRIHGLLALVAAALVLLPAIPARADQAYEKVASAYAQAGGQLQPCAFSAADLEAAIRGIPPAFRNTVPALRRAMEDALAAHRRGDCRGVRPEEGTTGGAATPGATTTPPVTTTPATTPTTEPAPAATTPTTTAPAAAAPASTTPTPPAAAAGTHGSDRTALIVALIAGGALLLAALLLWAWARMRGWDPGWVARMRHAWGEAGFRTTSTWAEFTDWLRLGR